MLNIDAAMPALRAALLFCAIASAADNAGACGYCIEDRIASVYDHAIVTRAIARHQQIAVFAIEGRLAGSAGEARALTGLAAAAWGVDRESVRVNVETATLSLAFDPAQSNFGTLQRFLQRKFTPRGLALMPLQVIDTPVPPKTAAR